MCREAVSNGAIKLEYCASTDMMAGNLTKPARSQKFKTVKHLIPVMVLFNETV